MSNTFIYRLGANWQGILSDSRASNWDEAGVEGDILHRTSIYTSLTSSATVSQINTAISDCSTAGGGVVELGAGTYSLTSKIIMKSNVTLRGAGMSTVLRFSAVGVGDGAFYFGSSSVAVLFGGTYSDAGYNATNWGLQQAGFPSDQKISWTGCGGSAGSYPKGATVLNLSEAPTSGAGHSPSLAVGDMLTVVQRAEDPANTLSVGTILSGTGTNAAPRDGFFVSSKSTPSPRSDGLVWEGAAGSGYPIHQKSRVVSISGSDVEIWPGLIHPTDTWKSSLAPLACWQGSDIRMAGIEDCRIDMVTSSADIPVASGAGYWSAVQFWQASNCWITRCWIQPKTGEADQENTYGVIHMMECRNCTVRSNWIGPCSGGARGTTTSYGCPMLMSTRILVENNIFDRVESPMLYHACTLSCVMGYNYEFYTSGEGGSQWHETGTGFNLNEGNITIKHYGDLHHGVSNFNTMFRQYNSSSTGINLQAYHRYYNVIGCVIASATNYTSTYNNGVNLTRFDNYAFRLGWPNQTTNFDYWYNGTNGVTEDAQVAATLMRWGNYTANDSTTRFSSSEVPSSDAYFPNSVPASQSLPASFYKTSRPSWFTYDGTTVQWPPIGPDVTGGVSQGGRVHKIPAQLAYEDAGGSGSSFNPSLYG